MHDIDALALQAARDLAKHGPRADLTIVQLPLLAAPALSDTIPIYHNNQTYQATVSSLSLGSVPNPLAGSVMVPADGTNTTGPTQVTFGTPYATTCLGVVVTVDFGGGPVYALSANAGSLLATGFQVVVFGSPNSGDVALVHWLSWGN